MTIDTVGLGPAIVLSYVYAVWFAPLFPHFCFLLDYFSSSFAFCLKLFTGALPFMTCLPGICGFESACLWLTPCSFVFRMDTLGLRRFPSSMCCPSACAGDSCRRVTVAVNYDLQLLLQIKGQHPVPAPHPSWSDLPPGLGSGSQGRPPHLPSGVAPRLLAAGPESALGPGSVSPTCSSGALRRLMGTEPTRLYS